MPEKKDHAAKTDMVFCVIANQGLFILQVI